MCKDIDTLKRKVENMKIETDGHYVIYTFVALGAEWLAQADIAGNNKGIYGFNLMPYRINIANNLEEFFNLFNNEEAATNHIACMARALIGLKSITKEVTDGE